jgi:hypothetical protein
MKHYLSYIEDVIKNRWELPAITNYGNNSLKNCDIARNIERLHILFEQCGIKVGDNVAICARNSAEWCVAFLAIATYKAVAVPLLADFLPENIANLVKISDSRMLFVDKSVLVGLQRAGVASGFGGYEDFVVLSNMAFDWVIEGAVNKGLRISSEYKRSQTYNIGLANIHYAQDDITNLMGFLGYYQREFRKIPEHRLCESVENTPINLQTLERINARINEPEIKIRLRPCYRSKAIRFYLKFTKKLRSIIENSNVEMLI